MTLLSKLDMLAYDMSSIEMKMKKCGQVSKTKKEINNIAKDAETEAEKIRKKIAAYRSTMDPIVAGAEENSVADEIMAICEDIGTAMYHLRMGNVQKANKLLFDINQRTRGY